MMRHLVSGSAGFIGFHTAAALLRRGDAVVGVDNINDYYDVSLKSARLKELDRIASETGSDYVFRKLDVADATAISDLFRGFAFDRVIHLAAQAGVRYSIEAPLAYVHSNVTGFTNILEACRYGAVPHLTYASTSSVYGANRAMPFSEHHSAEHPLQFYAATKKANEMMAHAYSHLFGLPTTGLRFFTVYGPWGRPDMAPMLFTKSIIEGRPIKVFNNGAHSRDFTYIDDIVAGVLAASDRIAEPDPNWLADAPDPATSSAPFRIFNIGNGRPVELGDFIAAIEAAVGREAIKEYAPLQPGDALDTFCDVTALEAAVGYRPSTSVEEGVQRLVAWYIGYTKGRISPSD